MAPLFSSVPSRITAASSTGLCIITEVETKLKASACLLHAGEWSQTLLLLYSVCMCMQASTHKTGRQQVGGGLNKSFKWDTEHTVNIQHVKWASSGLFLVVCWAAKPLQSQILGHPKTFLLQQIRNSLFANPQKLEDLETMNWPQILAMNHQSLT